MALILAPRRKLAPQVSFNSCPKPAHLYGLDQSQWVDERRSITRSTTAAVAHLRDLYERFRRWDLALAAYNAGVENVLRAMAKAAQARPRGAPATPIGFAELAQQKLLPEETMNYVPQIVAFAIVANNRTRFGLEAFHPDPPLELGELAVPEGTRLRTIARAAGISTHLVREYNPEILRDRTPTYGGDYIIHLPGERIQQTLAAFPAYLEHERVDDPNADRPGEQATAMAAPRIPGDELDDDSEAALTASTIAASGKTAFLHLFYPDNPQAAWICPVSERSARNFQRCTSVVMLVGARKDLAIRLLCSRQTATPRPLRRKV